MLGVDHGGGVEVVTGVDRLVHRQHHHHAELLGQSHEPLGGGTVRDVLGVLVVLGVLDLTEVRAVEQFLEAHHLDALLPGPLGELAQRLELAPQLIACYGNGAVQVEKNLEQARELCDSVPDEAMRWQALHGLRSCYLVRGRLRQARDLDPHGEVGRQANAQLKKLG